MKLPSASPFFHQCRGWERQLNMVSWNGNPPKYRHPRLVPRWQPHGQGISLTEDELKTLKGILDDMEL